MTFQSPSSSRAAGLLVASLIAAASACSSIRDQVVTVANRDAVASSVTQSTLSDEDKRLFIAVVVRAAAAEDLGHWSDAKPAYDGKTVAAIIEEERARLGVTQATQEQREKTADAEQSGAAALAVAIGKSLAVSVRDTRTTQFGALPSSYVKLVAENLSGKDITGFSGRLTVRDLFGEEVGHASVDVTEVLKSGARMTWEEFVSDVAVGRVDAKHLKFDWTPSQVTFQDGSQLSPSKPTSR